MLTLCIETFVETNIMWSFKTLKQTQSTYICESIYEEKNLSAGRRGNLQSVASPPGHSSRT